MVGSEEGEGWTGSGDVIHLEFSHLGRIQP
jgi:hypothetical protein